MMKLTQPLLPQLTAHYQGYSAGNRSKGPAEKSDCPYPVGEQRTQWMRGFDEGRFGSGGAQ